jgi:hypothetical protein
MSDQTSYKIRGNNFSRVFQTYEDFISFYDYLPVHHRLPFVSLMHRPLLLNLLSSHRLLEFFQAYHPTDEVFAMLRGIFMSRLPIDAVQELIEWLTWYKPNQIGLCSIIRPQIYDLINKDSLSVFLDGYKGNPVKLFKKGGLFLEAISNLGNFKTVCSAFASDPVAQRHLDERLFEVEDYYKQYSKYEVESLIENWDIKRLLNVVPSIAKYPQYMPMVLNRLRDLPADELEYLLRTHPKKFIANAATQGLLEGILHFRPDRERLSKTIAKIYFKDLAIPILNLHHFLMFPMLQSTYDVGILSKKLSQGGEHGKSLLAELIKQLKDLEAPLLEYLEQRKSYISFRKANSSLNKQFGPPSQASSDDELRPSEQVLKAGHGLFVILKGVFALVRSPLDLYRYQSRDKEFEAGIERLFSADPMRVYKAYRELLTYLENSMDSSFDNVLGESYFFNVASSRFEVEEQLRSADFFLAVSDKRLENSEAIISSIPRFTFTSLEQFARFYLKIPNKVRDFFLDKLGRIGGGANIIQLFVADVAQAPGFFARLSAEGDTHFVNHSLLDSVLSTPRLFACFMNQYGQDQSLIRRKRGWFREKIKDQGNLKHFLRWFNGDLLSILDATNTNLHLLNWSWDTVSMVHSQFKENTEANDFFTRWILQRGIDLHRTRTAAYKKDFFNSYSKHPDTLLEYYDPDRLFDVMSRLPAETLANRLSEYALIIKSPTYEAIVPKLLEVHGRCPAIGRKVYENYYPDLQHPFWAYPPHRLALLGFMETDETVQKLWACTPNKADLVDLERHFSTFLSDNSKHFQEYNTLFANHQDILSVVALWWSTLEQLRESSSSRSRQGLLLICLLVIFFPALLSHLSAGIYDKYTLSSERQAIFENPEFFPHIEPRQLQINLQRFSELCKDFEREHASSTSSREESPRYLTLD